MKLLSILLSSLFVFASHAYAETTHTYKWNATYITGNPDGLAEAQIVSCNGVYPWPDIVIDKGDRVIVELTNGLGNANTSVHFHGLFQHNTSQFDGVPMLTQCEIPPGETMIYNFTVPDQVGSFWYHSHSKGQYMDGMRGAFIIRDPEIDNYATFDEEVILTVSEWYHDNITVLTESFLWLYNPTGAEPIPQNLLWNNTMNTTWDVKPDTIYYMRLINTGGFVSQYIYLEDHNFTVVAVDGIYVEPYETSMIYITVAQRYDILIHTKNDTSKNYAFMQKFDDTMLDVIPDELMLNVTNSMVYNADADMPEQYVVDELDFLDDFYLSPVEDLEHYDSYDHQVVIDVIMDNLNNGVNYAFFNNITYTTPKVPTLGTVLSANETDVLNAEIYGPNTHPFVLQKDEIVEIVLNNQDTGTHPFHLHGHVFEVIERGPDYTDEAEPVAYNESLPYTPRDRPIYRDVLYVRPQSYFVIRFKANNPGVWFFHCHIEWHLLQGLALVFIEDPLGIRANETAITDNWKDVCEAGDVPFIGNAANHTDDFLNLEGANLQVKNLPAGFTTKGIVAMVFSSIAGFLGCVTIFIYGMADIPNMEERVIGGLDLDEQELLRQFNDDDDDAEVDGTSNEFDDDVSGSKDIELKEIHQVGSDEKK